MAVPSGLIHSRLYPFTKFDCSTNGIASMTTTTVATAVVPIPMLYFLDFNVDTCIQTAAEQRKKVRRVWKILQYQENKWP
jgi:hypothetical protein